MRQNLTGHTIANTVRMSRSLHKGAVMLVEGDTDARLYRRFVYEKKCKVIPAHNRDNAIDALKLLEDGGYKGILVIVDADFEHLEGIEPGSANLLLTDTHDLETMILSKSRVLENFLSEFGSRNVINRLSKPVRQMISESALPVGLLRWIASKNEKNLTIRFRDLSFENFVSHTKLQTNLDKLMEEACSKKGDAVIDEEAIKKEIKSLLKAGHDPWQACSGHDIVKVLTIGIRSIFGNKDAKSLTVEIIEKTLRMSYPYADFCLTELYKSIKKWEKTNPVFLVFKETS